MRSNVKPMFLAIAVLLSWFAIVLQFDLSLINRQVPLLQMLVKFFSYFTILTNILVAVTFSMILFAGTSWWGRLFSSAKVFTPVTVYIIIVGIIYNIILRQLGKPQGLNILTNEILHSIIPLITTLYWIFFIRKENLQWGDVWLWLIYPFLYICGILFIGQFSGNYPYPFINVANLGYSTVLRNSLAVGSLFTGLSFLMVAIAKLTNRKGSLG